MSAKAASASEFKWHNSLPEDYNAHRSVSNPEAFKSPTGSHRKRNSMFADVFDDATTLIPPPSSPSPMTNKAGLSLVSPNKITPGPVASPTKRRRSTNMGSLEKTPCKPAKERSSAPSRNGHGSNSGIHTPPPSSTSRRQGRSSKTTISRSQRSSRMMSPPPTSPSGNDLRGSNSLAAANAYGHEIELKDSRSQFTDDFGSKKLFGTGKPTLIGGHETDEMGQAVFDWSLIQNGLQNGVGDIFASSSSIRSTRGSSPDSHTDSVNYSFTDSDGLDHTRFGVNPNLIFTSQTSTNSSAFDESTLHTSFAVEQPYHHQQMQLQREQELKIKRRLSARGRILPRPSQSSLGDGSDIPVNKVRRKLRNIASDGLLISEIQHRPNGVNVARRTKTFQDDGFQSSLKGNGHIARSSPTKKTEVILSISPGGRAKAETMVVHEDSDTEIDNHGEWDSLDESDSSFDEETPRGLAPDGRAYVSYRRRSAGDHSQVCCNNRKEQTSFIPLDPSTPRKTLSAMLGSVTRECTIAESSPRLPTPLKSSPPPILGSHRKHLVNQSTLGMEPARSDDESEAETVLDGSQNSDDEDGDAMTALKRIVHASNRQRQLSDDLLSQQTPTKSKPSSVLKAKIGPTDVLLDLKKETSPARILFNSQTPRVPRSRRPIADGGYHKTKSSDDLINTSPTTVTDPDCTSERDGSIDDGSTRCTCGRSDDNGMTMVQCDSCKKWLHLKCIGYNRKSLPQVFICLFCNAETPPARGRTRGRNASSRIVTSPTPALGTRTR